MLFAVGIALFFALLESLVQDFMEAGLFEDVRQTPYNYFDDAVSADPVSILIALVMSVLSFCALAPLELGIRGWYYSVCSGAAPGMLAIFSFFSEWKLFMRSLGVRISLGLRGLFFAVLFLSAPAGLLVFGGLMSDPSDEMGALLATLLIIAGTVLLAVSALLYRVFMNRYFLVDYLVQDGENGISRAIKLSVAYMGGYKADIFLFELSFLPWWLLCIAVLPALYAVPYYSASRAMYAKYIIESGMRADAREEPRKAAPPPEAPPAQPPEARPEGVADTTQEYRFVPKHMILGDEDDPGVQENR